jgi:murein DD-endopeptidase MepM/ murein hydrolase activator NlpD
MRRRSGLISSAVCAVLMGSGVAIGGVGPTVAEVAPDMATALAPGMLDDVAQRIRRLHLAAFGIEAASGQVQASVERARAEQEALRSRHEKAAAQVERVRTAMARRAGAAIAAGRLNLDSRAVATRRAALQAQGISWNQAERELRDLRTAQVRLAAVVLDGERLGQELDLRAGQVAQQRDEIDDQPFAAVAMASRLRRLDQPVRQFAYRDETVVPPETDTMSLPRLAPAAMLTSAVPDEPAGPASPAGGAIRWPALGEAAVDGASAMPQEEHLSAWSGLLASVPAPDAAIEPDRITERGLLLDAPAGHGIVAPEGGRVVFAGPFRSYGQILIIDHGNDYHTLMAGFSHLDVQEGVIVRAGERIGSAGGVSGAPGRLYVEVRRRGVPVDPMPWLAAREDKVRG